MQLQKLNVSWIIYFGIKSQKPTYLCSSKLSKQNNLLYFTATYFWYNALKKQIIKIECLIILVFHLSSIFTAW